MTIQKLRDLIGLRSDYRKVFNTPEGRRVLRHLCRTTGITERRGAFTTNAESIRWLEAQRHLVFSILKNINQGDDALLKQIEEIERSNADDQNESNVV